MKKKISLSDFVICIKGGGDIASGVAWRLYQCGFRVYIIEIERPMAVRRKVAFCEAVYDGKAVVEGVEAALVNSPCEIPDVWGRGMIPVIIDPENNSRHETSPDILIDATIAKRNTGTSINHAPLVIALGPGFVAGRDAHLVIETNRGHNLGRVVAEGSAEPDTGVPGPVEGITSDRVLRSPADGIFNNTMDIGASVKKGDTVGFVNEMPVKTLIGGVLRGLVRPGISVSKGLKIGDVDPRGKTEYCFTISEKALAIAGGVLEGILRSFT
ncbi:MAG: EF2563 family selenium-dependent molybdenum hydroxylase system protein [Deltaproteobacteria bacterium]|nr:EF2563 family selenium-dependent molybdenum hydroxylase system protein [Deltaproteobacteria bacterium]